MPVTLIALLTDFGLRDPYVAAMKGVIASRCGARVEDLSHEIAPFDVWSGAFFLRAAVPYWPAGTIFVAVIDPGVGTSRRILAIERDGRTFLAPDNGVLALVAGPPAVSVENDAFFLPEGSTTFHGRDRFAPVAAAIASGTPLHELGPRVDTIVALDYAPPSYDCARAEGTIVSVDRFGNLVTDIDAARLPFPRFAARAGAHTIARLARAYGDGGDGAFLIVGSTGCIEISVANASAAALLQLSRGDRVTIVPA
jgi:S-adenosyl-L-methionine hydrolase (adenosine-forming)